MNQFDDVPIDVKGFAYRDLVGQDRWESFSVVFGSLTVIGATSYTGRLRVVGRQCQFQVQFSAATSIASVAGTDYMNLPMVAVGLSGLATMTNDTTNVAVGVCHVDVTNSRVYPPTQSASANTFTICGWYEIG